MSTCSKIPYETKSDAKSAAKFQMASIKHSTKMSSKKSNMKIRVYECYFCGNWHLTSQKKHKKRKRK